MADSKFLYLDGDTIRANRDKMREERVKNSIERFNLCMNRFWDKFDIEDALIKDGRIHIPSYYRKRMDPEMRKHISPALHALDKPKRLITIAQT